MPAILFSVFFMIIMALCIIDLWDYKGPIRTFTVLCAGTNLVACMLIAFAEMDKVMGY